MIKGSITKRLFIEIVLVVLSFSALILLSNTLLLKKLYYYSIKTTMISAMDRLSAIDYSDESGAWMDEIDAINTGNAYDIAIVSDGQIIYSSSSEIGLQPDPRSDGRTLDGQWHKPGNIEPFLAANFIEQWEQTKDGIRLGITKEPRTDSRILVCFKDLDDGTSIYLTQPVQPIDQSVTQSNILLIACTVLFLGVSAFIAFRISKRFTRPIKQIRSQVGKITRLDFGSKCAIATGDELQGLSHDVNQLSDTLQTALQTLRQQNIQLEKDMLSQRRFMSNASHELRTPLSLIKGYADEMNAGFVNDPDQQKFYLEIISEESTKMNRLLKEILDLFRLESGRMELQKERLSVHERILTFLEKYHGFISDNGLKISLDLKGDAMGFFDAMRFEQILANYISNAAKYGDGEKRVAICARPLPGSIRVSVFNSGNPIPDKVLPHIWDGFYKADDARTRVEGSYGLGLSIVKAIQSVAGQAYGVYNTESGVTFWFDVEKAVSQ